MSKHLADQRKASDGGRLRAFLRLARSPRETFHHPRSPSSGASRLQQFLRIARGRST